MSDDHNNDFIFKTILGGDLNSYENSRDIKKHIKYKENGYPYKANFYYHDKYKLNPNQLFKLSSKNNIINNKLIINNKVFYSGDGPIDLSLFIRSDVNKISEFLSKKLNIFNKIKIENIVSDILNNNKIIDLKNYTHYMTNSYIVFKEKTAKSPDTIIVLKNLKNEGLKENSICYIDNFNNDFVIDEKRYFIIDRNKNNHLNFKIEKDLCFFIFDNNKKIKINKKFKLNKEEKFFDTLNFLNYHMKTYQKNTFDNFILDEKRGIIELMIGKDAYLFYF